MQTVEVHKNILLVSSNNALVGAIVPKLESRMHSVKHISNYEEIDAILRALPHYDLVIIDHENGNADSLVELCYQIRKSKFIVQPLLFIITTINDEYFHIALFETGINEVMLRPKVLRLVDYRLKALLAQNKVVPNNIQHGTYLKSEKILVEKDDKEIIFTRKEFDILAFLVKNPNKVHTRQEIINAVWKNAIDVKDRVIDVHIRRIREKMGNDIIRTLGGVGYRINSQESFNII